MPSEQEIENLLGKLCVELGFCMTADDWERIVKIPNLDAAEFASQVIAAEAGNEWRSRLEEFFAAHMGTARQS